LAAVVVTLNLLAVLFHTIFDLLDPTYHLLTFMMRQLEKQLPPNTSQVILS